MTPDAHAGGFLSQPRAVLRGRVIGYIAGHAPAHVVVVNPGAGVLRRPVARDR